MPTFLPGWPQEISYEWCLVRLWATLTAGTTSTSSATGLLLQSSSAAHEVSVGLNATFTTTLNSTLDSVGSHQLHGGMAVSMNASYPCGGCLIVIIYFLTHPIKTLKLLFTRRSRA